MANYQSEVCGSRTLTPEQRETRLRELEEWGVDLSLIRTALARTPTERILLMQDRLALMEEMRRSWQKQYGARRASG